MNISKGEGSKMVAVTAPTMTPNAFVPVVRLPMIPNAFVPVVRPPMIPYAFPPLARPPMAPYAFAPVGPSPLRPYAFPPVVGPPMTPYACPPVVGPPMTPYAFPPVVGPPMIPNAIDPVSRPSSTLNSDAPQYRPETHPDKRSVFLTFSNGFPLTESQLFNFFDWWFPGFVENVLVHKPTAEGKPSLFGKVTFKRADITDFVLGYKEKVCCYVDGFPLYCNRFVSKKTAATGKSSNANSE